MRNGSKIIYLEKKMQNSKQELKNWTWVLITFPRCFEKLGFEKQHLNFIVRKLTTIIIRSTYCIYYMRNKPWTNPWLNNILTTCNILVYHLLMYSFTRSFFSLQHDFLLLLLVLVFSMHAPNFPNASYLIVVRFVSVY